MQIATFHESFKELADNGFRQFSWFLVSVLKLHLLLFRKVKVRFESDPNKGRCSPQSSRDILALQTQFVKSIKSGLDLSCWKIHCYTACQVDK